MKYSSKGGKNPQEEGEKEAENATVCTIWQFLPQLHINLQMFPY